MVRKLILTVLLVSPLGFYPLLRDDGGTPKPPGYRFSRQEELALHLFAMSPNQSFPAGLPWEPLRAMGEDRSTELRELADKKPIQFLEMCLNKYEQDVQGYRVTFRKQERVNGKLLRPERLVAHFRARPFSVHMDWKEGAGLALRTLYVEGENDDKLVARIGLFGVPGPIRELAIDDALAKASSRFPINRFGMQVGLQQTLDAIKAADAKGTLYLRFEGTERVEKLDNLVCYKFVRSPYMPPEEDGVAHFTFYIDPETLLQVGSILKDANGDLIAEYFFANVELNPIFDANQFTKKAM